MGEAEEVTARIKTVVMDVDTAIVTLKGAAVNLAGTAEAFDDDFQYSVATAHAVLAIEAAVNKAVDIKERLGFFKRAAGLDKK